MLLTEPFLRGTIALDAIIMANRLAGHRRRIPLTLIALVVLSTMAATAALATAQAPQQTTPVPGPGVVQLEANQQRKAGQVFYADGNVLIRYRGVQIQADHAEYNTATEQVVLTGHVQFDHLTEHLKADRAEYNLRTQKGQFQQVSGSINVMRKPNPELLVTPNPVSFEATLVERIDENTYQIYHAKMTVCNTDKPTWIFDAREATLHVDRNVAMLYTSFRLFRIPLIYLPYADVPNEKSRQSGFMMPEISNSSIKGDIVGDAYYWAPTSWADATAGAQLLTLRGWEQNLAMRMKPSENNDDLGDVLRRGGPAGRGRPLAERPAQFAIGRRLARGRRH